MCLCLWQNLVNSISQSTFSIKYTVCIWQKEIDWVCNASYCRDWHFEAVSFPDDWSVSGVPRLDSEVLDAALQYYVPSPGTLLSCLNQVRPDTFPMFRNNIQNLKYNKYYGSITGRHCCICAGCPHQVATLFSMKWPHGRHLERMISYIRNLTLSIDAYLCDLQSAKFHPDPTWNKGALCFFEDSHPDKNKMSRNMPLNHSHMTRTINR